MDICWQSSFLQVLKEFYLLQSFLGFLQRFVGSHVTTAFGDDAVAFFHFFYHGLVIVLHCINFPLSMHT